MRAVLLCLGLCVALAGCAAQPTWAPEEAVKAARYVHDGPKSITLFTVVSNKSGSGAHSGLLINASQQVMFDPAGSWYHPSLPERNDVHFGVTPKMVNFYIDYHARETYRMIEQTVIVTPEAAEIALQRALNHGAVPKAMCANSISTVLRGVPGFEEVPSTFGPMSVMKAIAKMPNIQTRTITDDDDDQNHGVLMLQQGDAGYEAAAAQKDEKLLTGVTPPKR